MLRILIVDDDASTRSVIEAMLQNAPALANVELAITTAEDGQAGLAALAEQVPDVAIIDLLMPRLDGFQTCKLLRGHPDAREIELCMISGIYRDAAIVKRVESEFGARFFGKPEGLRDLIVHVGNVAEQRARAAQQVAEASGSAPGQPEEVAQVRDLGFRSLAAVLLDLHESVSTGRLILRRSGVVKTIDLADGNLAAASSSTRDETLGHFLVTAGTITDDQHKQAVVRAVERGEKLGEALTAAGVITQAQLSEVLVAQLRYKIVAALRWPQGVWRFHRRPVDASRDVRLRVAQVVFTGLRETSTPESVQDALARLGGAAAIGLNDRGRRMLDDIRGVFGRRVADSLITGGTVDELTNRDANAAALRTAIDVLVRCEVLVIREPARAQALDVERGGGEVLDEFDAFESGVIEIGYALDDGARARERLVLEYHRIQGLDPYGVLMLDHAATSKEIAGARVAMCGRFERADYARLHPPADLAKLDHVLAAYDRAGRDLLEASRRAELDRRLSADRSAGKPSFRAELLFHDAERLLASGELAAAIACLRAAIAAAPQEPDYRASLGWALWRLGHTLATADEARPHLHLAVAIKPDHAAAHEYIGRIDAALGTDDVQAMFHLERALMLDPARHDALAAARDVLLRGGDAWALVRLHRRVLEKLHGAGALEVAAWLQLAEVLRAHVDDAAGEHAALERARVLAPGDPAVVAALAAHQQRHPGAADPWSMGVYRWTLDLRCRDPGVELWRWAEAHGQGDASFLAASALVALGHPEAEAEERYSRWRPRFVARARRDLSPDLWVRIRHPDDAAEIGALMDLIAPVVHAITPTTLRDLDVLDTMRVADSELPDSFRKLRSYVAALLGTAEPTVYVRPELGQMLHIGALAEPVLLIGSEALDSPDRLTLAFRLARAMSFLAPGRAIGGSRPGRVLRGATLAIVADVAPAAAPGIRATDRDHWIARASAALGVLGDDVRGEARQVAARLIERAPHINLSQWARALSRTADRVGLLVTGDLPLARKLAIEGGAADDDLVEFAIGAEHLRLRSELGLSIDV